jgi:hypothetical protein
VVGSLFEPPAEFRGLPAEGFAVFTIEDRDARRRAIVDAFHGPLGALGRDVVGRLEAADRRRGAVDAPPFHAHLPRLDWPRGYQPFCTWLALSREAHGYQSGPQLNVGVHVDHVAVRLGWDTAADAFGRFEFLCRRGDLATDLARAAAAAGLVFRVYAAASWPAGSRCVFASEHDVAASLDEVRRRGVWWELGRRWEMPGAAAVVTSPQLGIEAVRIFDALVPLYDRLRVDRHAGPT